ncbi:MAG: GFA family protein [Terricaulis sp.]|nr:GFA family protein [Terricaulis sp.]
MSANTLQGRCLCGAVRFEAAPEKLQMGACHCSMCRRWSGGVFLAVECGALAIADESQLGIYKSSDWGERCFCKTCGSTLFWRMQDGSHAAVSAQAFEEPGKFTLVSEIFVDEQPASYAFANATKRMTGAEFIAAFQAGAENTNG